METIAKTSSEKPPAKKFWESIPAQYRAELVRLKWLLLIAPVLLLLLLAALAPGAVEVVFSRGLFLLLNTFWNYLFGFFPFSVAEWLFYIVVVGVPACLIVMAALAFAKRVKWVRFVRLCVTLLISAGILFNAFYLLWGFNYYRQPLKGLLPLDVRERSVEELTGLCQALANTAWEIRTKVEEDADGVFMFPGGAEAALSAVPPAYKSLGTLIPLVNRVIPVPKPVMNGKGMSVLGISGVYIPFTAEANVNMHQPDLLIPSSAAHEGAHSVGFAREDEANFLAYLACLCSEDVSVQYSGVMLALIHSGNALYEADPEAYAVLRNSYSEGMKRDLAQHNAYWALYDGPIAEGMDQLNDSYLKFNSQESGIKSYGEMVDLLLAWHYREV